MERVLELEKLCLGYNKVIYQNIFANAGEGEVVAVVGPNGIGKSTLLKSIGGMLKYHSGAVQ